MPRSRSLVLIGFGAAWSLAGAGCVSDSANPADAGVFDATSSGAIDGSPGPPANDASGSDAAGDAGGSDGASNTGDDAAASDSGAGDAASESGGPVGFYYCPDNTTVAACSQCVNAPQPCISCNVSDPSKLIGTCVQQGACAAPSGYVDCKCQGDSGSCAAAFQVCINVDCYTCGESGSAGLKCQSGGTCDGTVTGCH